MVKRAKKNNEAGAGFKKLLQEKGFSQYKLEQVTGIDKSVISKIANGYTAEPKLETLEKIAAALGVELPQLTEIFISSNTNSSQFSSNPQPQEFSSKVSTYKNPDFLGREKDIEELNNLVNEGAKVILIKAEGGIGKTTLAKKWFEIQGLKPIKLTVGLTSPNVDVEEWVSEKLEQYFSVKPALNFGNRLEQLQTELQENPIGIFIDNLEPALQNGKFIETQKNYVDLLFMLADKKVNCITIITSREEIYEYKILSLPTFKKYDLERLSQEAWQEYFENQGIKIDDNSLNAMWKNYGGNALAMEILPANILQESKGDLKIYWQDNSEDLLRHRSLEQLVQSQFDKLRNDNLQSYNLLCRLGVYPNQNIDLPEVWLYCLLWDVPENRRKRVIDDLLSRCLVKKHGEGYYLHPVIRVEATERCNYMNINHNTYTLNLKKNIDNIILNNHKIQSFLNYINKNLFFVSQIYNKSAFRAVHLGYLLSINDNTLVYSVCDQEKHNHEYFELAYRMDQYFEILSQGIDFTLDTFIRHISNKFYTYLHQKIPNIDIKIQQIKSHPHNIDFMIHDLYNLLDNFLEENILYIYEYYLEMIGFLEKNILNDKIFNLECEIIVSSFSFEKIKNILENGDFEKIRLRILQMGDNIISRLTFKLDEFRDLIIKDSIMQYDDKNNSFLIANTDNKSENTTLIDIMSFSYELSDLHNKWKFENQAITNIRDYYNANLLLTYCLNYASPEVRSHIEDTLLLPIEEIEKRPFKN